MQRAGSLPDSSPKAAPALVSLLWRGNPNHQEDTEWGVKDQRQISEDALSFSLWEGVGQKWGHKEAHFESLTGPEELKTVNEGSKRAGYFFFPQNLKFIYLYFIYFAYQIFCMILITFWFLMGAVNWVLQTWDVWGQW